MCFNISYQFGKMMNYAARHGFVEDYEYWKKKLEGYIKVVGWDDFYQVSGFTHPKIFIFENEKPYEPVASTWGLIPHWAKEPEKIWNNTLNARGETILEKSSFRKSAETKRCLIPVDGFYDFHDYKGKKYPFYVTGKNNEPLVFAGLWNDWTNKDTGEVVNTFSIVTTRANPLMAKIHNKPKNSNDPRMPVILPEDLREMWLKPLSKQEVKELATYVYPDSKLDAWTVRKLSGKDSPGNVLEASEKFEYADFNFDGNTQLYLFM
jgi:putative SOS response-associated peptidase YedK